MTRSGLQSPSSSTRRFRRRTQTLAQWGGPARLASQRQAATTAKTLKKQNFRLGLRGTLKGYWDPTRPSSGSLSPHSAVRRPHRAGNGPSGDRFGPSITENGARPLRDQQRWGPVAPSLDRDPAILSCPPPPPHFLKSHSKISARCPLLSGGFTLFPVFCWGKAQF